MKFKFDLSDIKPLNLNHCYTISSIGGKVRRFPSKEYKQYESLVNLKLRSYRKTINDLIKAFDEEKHYLVAEYVFYYPILTKKDNRVSKRSIDLSNSIKALEDIIFKNFGHIDDSAVCSLNVHKIHSENIRVEITFNIKDIRFIA